MGNQKHATTPRRLTAKQRQARALALREAGGTYQSIADTLGYKSRQSAYDAVNRELKKLTEQNAATAEQLRALELQRLDSMQLIAWAQATTQKNLAAIDRVIRISERRAKLCGLDLNEQRQAEAAETQAAITAATAEAIYQIITRVLDGLELTPAQKAKAPVLIMQELAPQEEDKKGD